MHDPICSLVLEKRGIGLKIKADIEQQKRKYVTDVNTGKMINQKLENPEYLTERAEKKKKQTVYALTCIMIFFLSILVTVFIK